MIEQPIIRNLRRWLPRTGSVTAYIVAALLVLLGVIARLPLDAIADRPLPPYITLYPVIIIAAFAGGIRVGLFAAAISAVIAWTLWIAPPIAPDLPFVRLVTGVVYVFTAAITVLVSGGARVLVDEMAKSDLAREQTARESIHRIKNLLAIVQSLSRKLASSTSNKEEYRDRLEQRLAALATAQDILIKKDWTDISVKALLQAALAPFIPNPRLEIKVEADLVVPKRAVTQLSMALYELATNSMKHGALANTTGLVRIQSRLSSGRCSLEWLEVGLPSGTASGSVGLGSTIIRSALSAIDDGVVSYDVTAQSVSCLFEWPQVKPPML